MPTVAYQGIEGSHSHVILLEYLSARGEAAELVGFPTSKDVALAVVNGQANFGILPIDNASSGTFRDGYDLIARHDLRPVREVVGRTEQTLLALEGATLSALRRVYGLPSALEGAAGSSRRW